MNYTGELVVTSCWCGINLAIPRSLYDHAHDSVKNNVFCPLGHSFVFRKSEAQKQRERADQAEATARRRQEHLDRANARVEHERARVRGYQGALAKAKKRGGK